MPGWLTGTPDIQIQKMSSACQVATVCCFTLCTYWFGDDTPQPDKEPLGTNTLFGFKYQMADVSDCIDKVTLTRGTEISPKSQQNEK